MADGKVVIDVILDDGTVVKGVTDVNKKLGGLEKGGEKAALGIGKIVTALGLVAIGSKAIGMLTGALDGAIARYDTLNNFPAVLQLMGFSAEDSAKAIEKLSDGIDGLPTTLDSVASTAQRLAIMTGDLDKATETTLALNNAFLASGSSAGDASRGLEQYVQMLSRGEVDLAAWRTIQETMPVALNKVAEAFGFTGASAQNDLYDALKEGNITFDQFNDKIIELSNASGGFAELAKTSSTGIKTSWQNMKTAIVKGVADVIRGIDEALGGVGSIAGLFDKAKAGIKTFFNYVVVNIPVAVQWLAKIRDTLEPWLPLIKYIAIGLGTFVVALGLMNSVVSIALGIWKALNAVLAMNPWILLAAMIVAVAVLIYVYWEPIKNFFIQLWEGIKTAGLALWDSLKEAWAETVSWLVGIWTPIKNYFVELWRSVSGTFSVYWDLIKSYISMVLGSIKTIISTWWNIIKTLFAAAFLTIFYLVTGQWDKIKEVWAAAITKIIGLIKLMAQDIISRFNSFSDKARKVIADLVTKVISKWLELKSSIKTRTAEIVSSVISFFAELPSKVRNKVAEMATEIYKKFTDIKSNMRTMGADMITGLISGITSMAKDLANKVVDTISGAVNKAKSFLGIKSPSRLMRDMFGRNMMLGYQVGIDKEKASTIRKMEEATGWMTPKQPFVSGFVNSLRGVSAPIGNVLPASAITGGGTSAPSTSGENGNIGELVGAINNLAKRPINVGINGRQFIRATRDEINEALNIGKIKKEVFE